MKTIEKGYAKNFYVLNTETNGFKHNEPIQIAILLYEKGKEIRRINRHFLPVNKITESARKTHGKTRKILQ